MIKHVLYENLVKAWPIRRGKGRLLGSLTRFLNIEPYNVIRHRRVGKYRLYLDPGDLNDRLYYFDLIGFGYCGLMERVLRPGDTVVDVGANVGYFSTNAAFHVGKTGKVFAVEPNPSLGIRLQAMAAEVPEGPIKITRAAIWRESGTVTLQIDKKWSGWASLVENETFSADEAVKVEAIAIDDLIAQNNIDKVRLLKLDVEGAETDALIGARKLLGSHQVDMIQIETEPHRMKAFGRTGQEMSDLLTAYDYRPIGVIEQERIRTLQKDELIPGTIVGDYLFAHSSVANEIVSLLFRNN